MGWYTEACFEDASTNDLSVEIDFLCFSCLHGGSLDFIGLFAAVINSVEGSLIIIINSLSLDNLLCLLNIMGVLVDFNFLINTLDEDPRVDILDGLAGLSLKLDFLCFESKNFSQFL